MLHMLLPSMNPRIRYIVTSSKIERHLIAKEVQTGGSWSAVTMGLS